ncbi:MAG: ComEA family DNA-binding protein, partial [Gemmatimonadota bacterium]|nr:ComEA family DNA-binding protein [Gemmatimonadota bacterium]
AARRDSGRGRPRPAGPPVVPVGPFNRIDVDRASPQELQRLPGIGPVLAARIVAYRDSNGPFGGLDRLRRVKGIGPATAARLDSLVRFSGVRRP